MATITDPATELSDVASNLLDSSSTKGAAYLAEKFEVEPWSTDFYKIIACILERADLVSRIVECSDLKPINRDKAVEDITAFKIGFASSALYNSWNNGPGGLTAMRDHGARLGFLENTVRQVVSYPELEEHERKEMISLIEAYMEEIQDSNEGPTFVRQAIMDGLMSFRFKLEYLNWMGSGYLLTEFRAFVEIYKQANDYLGPLENVDAGKVLKGMWTVIERFRGAVETVKPYTEALSYVWAGYSMVSPFFPMLAAPLLKLTGPQ